MTGSVGSASAEDAFGTAVRQAREDRGWSQEALATRLAAAGINVGGQSGVARIEKGQRPTRLNEVVAIAKFLEINLNRIYVAHGSSTPAAGDYSYVALDQLRNGREKISDQLSLVGEDMTIAITELRERQAAFVEAESKVLKLRSEHLALSRMLEEVSAELQRRESENAERQADGE